MDQDEFDKKLEQSPFLRDAVSELIQHHREIAMGCEHALAMIVTAVSRQLDAAIVIQNLERMEKMFSENSPNHFRTQMIRTAISLLHNSGRVDRGHH